MQKIVRFGAFIMGILCTLMPLGGCNGGSESSNDQPQITYDLKTEELAFRDPCIFADWSTKTYYIVGTLYEMTQNREIAYYQSKDLENWGGYTTAMPNNGEWSQNWAPELHEYNGAYYLFANLRGDEETGDYRGCYILKSDTPNGVYEMHSGRITPENWECLDATLYVEDGIPYMIYCREWTRMIDGNGEIYVVRLKDDLSGVYPGAEHVKLFAARDHTASTDGVTDGCWMYNAENGDLVMFWSKYINGEYAIITSRSKSGKIDGEWTHDPEPLFTDDGGHAMIFKDFNGELRITFHVPNSGDIKTAIYYLEDNNGEFRIIKK